MITGLVGKLLDLPIQAWPQLAGIGNCHWTVLTRRSGQDPVAPVGLQRRHHRLTVPTPQNQPTSSLSLRSAAAPAPGPGRLPRLPRPHGPMPADDPRLWPNVAATRLGGTAHLFAGFGWTARDAWWALTGDPNIWSLLPTIDALVLGVGSMDTLPSPLPTYLRTGLRYLRPDRLRRAARSAYLAAQPVLSRALGGRPVALPPALSVRYLRETVHAVRALRPDLPAVAILPGRAPRRLVRIRAHRPRPRDRRHPRMGRARQNPAARPDRAHRRPRPRRPRQPRRHALGLGRPPGRRRRARRDTHDASACPVGPSTVRKRRLGHRVRRSRHRLHRLPA